MGVAEKYRGPAGTIMPGPRFSWQEIRERLRPYGPGALGRRWFLTTWDEPVELVEGIALKLGDLLAQEGVNVSSSEEGTGAAP